MQRPYRNLFLLCLLVAVGSFAMGFAARRYSAQRPGAGQMWLASLTGGRGLSHSPEQTFAAVLENLEDSYVDRITDEKPLTYGALRQMMDELDDPNSRFLDPGETRDLMDAEDGTFHGIGAVVNIEATRTKDGERRRAVVADVLPGSPAERAGLHVGDAIVKIDDQWVYQPYDGLSVTERPAEGAALAPGKESEPEQIDAPEAVTGNEEDRVLYSTHDIMSRISQDGRPVVLMVLGPKAKSLERVEVETAPTTVRAAEVVKSGPDVAEIRLGGFTKTAGPDLDAALREVESSGAKKLVVDLRGCVGGPAERAAQVAGRFVNGPIGLVERRHDGQNTRVTLTARRTEDAWTGPLVVLVDRSTLGTAELLASALAGKAHATLVGQRTFGDGIEHTVIPLKDGSSLLMATGKFLMGSGQTYQARGVAPTVSVASAAEQRVAALRVLNAKG